MKKLHPNPYERRTLPLTGTVSRLEVQLDHPSALAVAYARAWLTSGPAATGLDAHASGVIRRALAVYMAHLMSLSDPQAEARAVRSCCSTLRTASEDRGAAVARLKAHQTGQPFPTFADVLHGPDSAAHWKAFDARVEALVQQINRESTHQMRRNGTPTP